MDGNMRGIHALIGRYANFGMQLPKKALFGCISGNNDDVNITRMRGGGRQ